MEITLGQLITDLRVKRGSRRKPLAANRLSDWIRKETGVDVPDWQLRRYEVGKSSPPFDHVRAIAQLSGVSLDEVVPGPSADALEEQEGERPDTSKPMPRVHALEDGPSTGQRKLAAGEGHGSGAVPAARRHQGKHRAPPKP